MKINIEYKARPGSQVYAKNYNRKGRVETGIVKATNIGIHNDGGYGVSYEVILDRRSENDRPLRLYLGNEGIELINF